MIIPFLVIFLLLSACSFNTPKNSITFLENADLIIDLKHSIIDIETNLYFSFGSFYLLNNNFIINEYAPKDTKAIHLLNRHTYEYITSSGFVGRGPGEITRMGPNIIDYKNSIIWVNDYGNYVRWMFPLDSMLSNPNFLPSEKKDLNPSFFLNEGAFLDNNTVIGNSVIPLSASSAEMVIAKLDFNTNEIVRFGHEPKRFNDNTNYGYFALSLQDSIYVISYNRKDLMVINDLNGDNIAQIIGPNIAKKDINFRFFTGVDIYNSYIITSYIGAPRSKKINGQIQMIHSNRFLVFNTKGEYLKTLEMGTGFSNFVADEVNQRLIIYFDDREHVLGYIDLSKILPK